MGRFSPRGIGRARAALTQSDAPRPAPGIVRPSRLRGRPQTTERPQCLPQRDHPINQMAGSLRLAATVDELADASRLGRRPLTAADVLTAGEVARLLHVPKSTVEDWARRGVIPSRKVGRRRLYLRQRIEALLLDDRA